MGKRLVIVVGGGFAGAFAAKGLRKRLPREEWDVVLLDRNNFLLFYPLLPEVAAGTLEPRHVAVPLRSFLPEGRFIMGQVRRLDLAAGEVEFQVGEYPSQRMPYDHLVLAVGSVTRVPDIPGVREHGYELKGIEDAIALRDRGIQLLEYADAIDDPEERRKLLTFVVVGANYTGVELAGEYQDFLTQASKAYGRVRREDIRVVLVEYGPRILPGLTEDLSRFAHAHLERRGVRVLTGRTVQEATAEGVRLTDGEWLPAATLIWCAGIAPNPLITGTEGLPLTDRGYVLAGSDLRVQDYENVWAIGDIAAVPGPDGKPYAPTAQVATRQADVLAENVARAVRGQPGKPFTFKDSGSIAALGCRTAVAKVFGLRLAGFPAWFLYRTVYLLKMPTWGRRIRVVLDWTADLFAKQEPVQMGLRRR
jgi:NADH dehydrogenase